MDREGFPTFGPPMGEPGPADGGFRTPQTYSQVWGVVKS